MQKYYGMIINDPEEPTAYTYEDKHKTSAIDRCFEVVVTGKTSVLLVRRGY